MARPILRLFGAFQLEVAAGKPVSLPTKKTKALLAYLAFHDNQPHERAKLAALLWADSAETQARESLRQTLSALRRALPGVDAQALATHGDTVTLRSEGLSIDVVEFGRLARGGAADLDRAAELYRGEFLEGFDLRVPEFETWLLSARRHLNEQAIKALSRLLSLHAEAGDVERGVTIATRILSLDPLQEGVHRSLMEFHGRQGRFAAALQQYRICSDVLSRQLGVEPEAATTALYREIREQRNRLRDGEAGGDKGGARPRPRAEARGGERAPPGAGRPLEKRQITIMSCDLFRLEAHAPLLDPEDLQPVLDACRKTCVDIMSGFGGVVRKFSGDGMTVCFGYPQASEHSAEQAVRAALALVDAMPRLETAVAGQVLAGQILAGQILAGEAHFRAGIATGPVLIGDLPANADMTEALVGEAPKLATLLQSLARPGSVMIAQETRALVGDLFDYVQSEETRSLGLAPAWRVIGECKNESRFDARSGSRAMTFVGRERELECLLDRWRSARASGWLELIEGEAGIGKSRLARAFQETIAGEPHQWLHYQCSPFHANSPLHPVVQNIERAARLSGGEAPDQKLDKLELMLAALGPYARDAVLYLALLLSIPVGGRYAPLTLNPAQQRRKILATLLSHVENLARQNPVVMMFEDAHWADASTLEFLALLVERIRQLPVLVLVTYRPGLDVPWNCLDHVGTLSLGGLDENNTRSIIRDVSRDRHLPPEIVAEIVRKADGIPLFVEELAKAVMEAGAGASDPLARRPTIPASLRDSLTARLDRLASAREIAQTGAVIGREFSHRLIEAVAGIPGRQLEEGLAILAESGLINAGGPPAERSYVFKHALVQDAAYETIAKSRRRNLHAAVAQAILNATPDVAETQPEVLARHYTEAGMTAEALGFWLKSGRFAAGRSAHKEAIAHFDRGLDLLKSGPLAEPERTRRELLFLTAMGTSVMALHGFGAVESQDVFQKAHDLLDDSTPFPDRLQILCGLWNIRFHGGELAPALPIAQQCLELAHASKAGLDLANCMVGQTLASMGEFAAALPHFQPVIENYRTGMDDPNGRFLVDHHVLAFNYTARILWALGFLLRSAEASREVMAHARERAHPVSVASAFLGRLFQAVHGMPLEEGAVALAREAVAYCEDHELVPYQRWIRFLYGALLAQEGDTAAGVEVMEAAVSAAEASRNRTFRPVQLACIGEAHARLGNAERGLDMLGEAIAMAEAHGEQQSLAMAHRFRGDILAGLGRRRDAARAFEAALSVARRQGNRIEELRVAMAMVRHAAGPDDAAAARKVLGGVYAAFEEGNEFPDLQAARGLLG